MKVFKQLTFLLCLPSIFLNTPIHAEVDQGNSYTEDYSHFSPWDLLNYETLSFSRIINFVYEIEYEKSLESILSQEQVMQVMDFVIFLARNGIRDDDTEGKQRLEEDIAILIGNEDFEEENTEFWSWFSKLNGYEGYKIKPAILGHERPQIQSCGWISKAFKKTKQFVKKHKKTIIISAAVVVAATVIIIATGGTAAPVLGAAGAAAGGVDRSRPRINKPGDVAFEEDQHRNTPNGEIASPNICQQPYQPQIEEAPRLTIPIQEVVAQQSSVIKQELSEQILDEALNVPEKDQPTFWESAIEKARETGSLISHDIYDGVTDCLEIVPQVMGVVSDRLPESLKGDPLTKDPREAFHDMVEAGHEKIDDIFGTNQADMYPTEAKSVRDKLTTGMLPPPGGSNIAKNGKPLSQAYINARKGIKHAKTLKDYSVKPSREIEKGIRSFEKQISKHKDKIANPSNSVPQWNKLDVREQEALITKKWLSEIKGFEEQRDILQSILDERTP